MDVLNFIYTQNENDMGFIQDVLIMNSVVIKTCI